MGLKDIEIFYQARNKTTGLANVKGQVSFNGVEKAVGGSAVVFTEYNATHSPGVYRYVLTAANLVTWGAVEGAKNTIEVTINSATQDSQQLFKQDFYFDSTDDIYTRMGAPVGASLSADIAAVKADTAAVKTDVEDVSTGLAAIKTAIDSIANQAGFAVPVPAELIKPVSGSNLYRIPITIYNNANALLDPDSNSVVVTLVNPSGTDRSTYLTGNSGGSAPAVRDSLGQYHIDVNIASGAASEELIFKFAYAISSAATARMAVSEVVDLAASSGLALQSTLLSVQTAVDAIKLDVEDATNGLPAIKTAVGANNTLLSSGTYGLAAIKTAVDSANSVLADGTYGNAALQTMLADIEGASFVSADDSLHAIKTFLAANIFVGGQAV